MALRLDRQLRGDVREVGEEVPDAVFDERQPGQELGAALARAADDEGLVESARPAAEDVQGEAGDQGQRERRDGEGGGADGEVGAVEPDRSV